MILSTSFDKSPSQANCYVYMEGTSMACPHIAGLAALLCSRGITDPTVIRNRLQENVSDLGASGKDNYYGYGLPNACAVLDTDGLLQVKVFYGLADGTFGAFTNPDSTGDYTLNNIPIGQKYICAFLDRNCNNLVDTGDGFGFSGPVDIQADTTTPDIDITLQDISSGSSTLVDYLQSVLH